MSDAVNAPADRRANEAPVTIGDATELTVLARILRRLPDTRAALVGPGDDAAVIAAWEQASGLFCLNAAPARPIDVDADLTVVNRYELEVLKRRDGLVALTLGAEGAVLLQEGEEVARAEPPSVEAVDGSDLRLSARSLCVHGDTPDASRMAHRIRAALERAHVRVEAFA